MDNEEKFSAFHDGSLDPDAAELLKELEDDDDEEGFEPSPLMSTPSLVRIMSSAALIETSATIPNQTAVSVEGDVAEELGAEASDLSDSDPAVKAVALSASSDAEESDDGDANLAEGSGVSEKTLGQAKLPIPPIKAFSEQVGERKSPPSAKRPPTPPRMPSGANTPLPSVAATPPASPAPGARVLRQGEVIYTQEAINGILAGGINDEGRDIGALKTVDNGWYTQIFNEDYFRTISKSSPRQTRREAKFIVDRLGIEKGARVLDLCCGYGRHTIELAKQGFDMVGLDLSMVMLKKALADAQAGNQIIKFVHGDMQKLTFKAVFDAVYNVQTSFGYFDDLRNFKVLQGVYRALKPGGVLLIETINRDFVVEELPLRLWWKATECMLLEEIDMEHFTGVLKIKRSFVFEDSGRAPWEQNIHIRLYTPIELRAMLMRAGFNVLELSGDYSLPGAFFGATSPRIIFVAEKSVK